MTGAGTGGRPTILFIGGAGRSGSTLLECMLDRLPGVVAAGEVTHLWDRGMRDDQLCGCGRPFSACPFWADVMRAAFGKNPPATAAELVRLRRRALSTARWPFARQHRDRYLSLLGSLYRAIADVSGARVVVDSSKYPPEAFLIRHLARREFTVRFVQLIREPNAVVFSWQRKRLRPEIHDRTEYMPRYPWWKTTAAWMVYNGLFDLLGRTEPGSVVRVRYDELVEDPDAVVRRIAGHVDIDPGGLEFIADGQVTLEPNHTVSGNPGRFRTGVVPLARDAEWRALSPRWRVRLVDLLTAPQRRAYGLRRSGGAG